MLFGMYSLFVPTLLTAPPRLFSKAALDAKAMPADWSSTEDVAYSFAY